MDESSNSFSHGPAVRPARWYHLVGKDRHGPTDLATMRRRVLDGAIRADTLVWADGMPDWLPARDVPALTPPPELRHGLR